MAFGAQVYENHNEQLKWREILNEGQDSIIKNVYDEDIPDDGQKKNEHEKLNQQKFSVKAANEEYITDRFIIKYKDESGKKAVVESLQDTVKGVKSNHKKKTAAISTNELMTANELLSVIEQKGKKGEIAYIQPDYEMMIAAVESV